MLIPVAAAAFFLLGAVGPAADAQPHVSLIAGIGGRIPPGQLLHHPQPLALQQGGGGVIHCRGRAPPPDGAVVEPGFFDHHFQILRVCPFFHRNRHFKHMPGRRLKPLNAFHPPGKLLSLRVKAKHAYLNAADFFIGQVIHLHGEHRLGRGGHFAMP